MKTPQDTLKAKLRNEETTTCIWLSMGSALTAELSGNAGFDWCLVDGEHGHNSLIEMLTQVHALQATKAESKAAVDSVEEIARVDGVDSIFIGPADLSADLGHTGQSGHPVA